MPHDLEPGAVLADRYRLDHRLGEGGMGVVWAATHTITRKRVALKLLKDTGDDARHRARLVREARAASAVRHPNVCVIHDVLELEDGSPVMVMEHLAGEPLAGRLSREGKLAVADFAALFVQVVSAVGAAHALGIVHRDLKPENIFLGEGSPPLVKVLDFGIAKLTASEGDAAATAALTSTGALVGTPYYMSPEQAFGEKDLDVRSDVWSLGLIAYRCLSGVLPTEADNLGQVLKNIVLRPIRPLEAAAPGLPSDLTALVGRMLSRARKDRPSDLHEVTEVLARHTHVRAPDFGASARRPARALTPDTAADDGSRGNDATAPGSTDALAPADVSAVAGPATNEVIAPIDPLAETAAAEASLAEPRGSATPDLDDSAGAPPPRRAIPRRAAVAAVVVGLAVIATWLARPRAPALHVDESARAAVGPTSDVALEVAAGSVAQRPSAAISEEAREIPGPSPTSSVSPATAAPGPSPTPRARIEPRRAPPAPTAAETAPREGAQGFPVQKDW